MAPPFRADHVGSLLRPSSLLEARTRAAKASRQISYTNEPDTSPDLLAAQSAAIAEAVKQQLQRDIRPLTDGEYARGIFYGGFFEHLGGFEVLPAQPIPDAFRTDFPTTTLLASKMGVKTRPVVVATGKIQYKSSPYLSEWLELRRHIPPSLWSHAKITMPAPSYQHIQLKPGTAWTAESGYGGDEAYFADLAACYAQEFQTLYEAGVRNIQIDDPHLTYFCDPRFLAGCRKDGDTDPDALLAMYVRAHNAALRDKPADLHVGLHLCRGNFGSNHFVEGSYERIAEILFTQTDYQTFYLEFTEMDEDVDGNGNEIEATGSSGAADADANADAHDPGSGGGRERGRDPDPDSYSKNSNSRPETVHQGRPQVRGRTGTFEPLRHLPPGKNVILGLISTKDAKLEDRDLIKRKVLAAAQVIAAAQGLGMTAQQAMHNSLGLSPQCGFSSSSVSGADGMGHDRMWEKLELVRDLAREVWGSPNSG